MTVTTHSTPATDPDPGPDPDVLAPAARPRVVVGVDGSASAARALDWALRHAQLTGASLDVVGCWTLQALGDATGYGAYTDPSAFDLAGLTEQVLESAVAAALEDVTGSDSVVVVRRVVQGYPPRVLLQAAEGADLLVVGSRGHGEIAGLLLGSVGLYCVSHATCPIVVVRCPDDD